LGGAWLEPLTVLSVLAGRTGLVRLGTAILVAPLRRPAVLAKTLATLDVLSGGRLDVGLGIGWHRPEYAASGVEFAQRGALLDESLRICRLLWTEGPASYRSETTTFERVWCEPKPLQAGGPPIWLSGTLNRRNAARIVEHGSGWIPWAEDRSDLLGSVVRLRRLLEAQGRDPESVVVQGPLPAVVRPSGRLDARATVAPVAALVAGGVGDFIVRIPPHAEQSFDEVVAIELVERFREAAR
jgi:probable F420-dependent oxidoreductase